MPLEHVVKCLVFYHPDDDPALREEQEAQVVSLLEACRATRHELLLEVMAGKSGDVDSGASFALAAAQPLCKGGPDDLWRGRRRMVRRPSRR